MACGLRRGQPPVHSPILQHASGIIRLYHVELRFRCPCVLFSLDVHCGAFQQKSLCFLYPEEQGLPMHCSRTALLCSQCHCSIAHTPTVADEASRRSAEGQTSYSNARQVQWASHVASTLHLSEQIYQFSSIQPVVVSSAFGDCLRERCFHTADTTSDNLGDQCQACLLLGQSQASMHASVNRASLSQTCSASTAYQQVWRASAGIQTSRRS